MAAQKITAFLGILPRTAERLLPDMAAQVAENVNLTSGEIRPTRLPYVTHVPAVLGQKQAAYRAEYLSSEKWRTWDKDIDIIRGPLSPDVEPRYYWTGEAEPRYATFTAFGTTDYALGIPNPTTQSTVSATGGSSITTISRSYCYTFYQPATGEESGPSKPSDIVSNKLDATWTVTGFSNTPANDRSVAYNTGGLKQRLYRTTGTTGSWQLVAERAISTANWTDNLTDAQILGDDLLTSGWEPPPAGLKGVIVLPNGAAVGFVGNQILYSEPYQCHTFPKAYRYQVESDIVGIAAYGTTVVACTKTRPFIADGVTPDTVTVQSAGDVWPCFSKRSVCSVGDGVVFATRHGLAYIGQAGTDIFTKGLFTVDEWTPLSPASMVVKMAEGRVYVSFLPEGGATRQLLRLDLAEAAQLASHSGDCNTIYVDPLNGKLYLVSDRVSLFDGTFGTRNTYVWKSKQIEMPDRINFGAAIIEWEGTMSTTEVQAAYALFISDQVGNQGTINAAVAVGAFGQSAFNVDPVNGAFGIAAPRSPEEFLEYTLLDHDSPVCSLRVISGQAFRLPAGYKTDVVTHQLVGNVRVRYVKVAETMMGLKQV